MPQTVPYVHYLDGRIRLHVPTIKSAPAQARALEALVHTLEGVTGVTAHPTTGNVIIRFASETIGPEALVEALQQAGYPPRSHQQDQPGAPVFSTVMQSAIQVALEHLLLALC
jgi:hypothetical protein